MPIYRAKIWPMTDPEPDDYEFQFEASGTEDALMYADGLFFRADWTQDDTCARVQIHSPADHWTDVP